jgi:hypothetical protein
MLKIQVYSTKDRVLTIVINAYGVDDSLTQSISGSRREPPGPSTSRQGDDWLDGSSNINPHHSLASLASNVLRWSEVGWRVLLSKQHARQNAKLCSGKLINRAKTIPPQIRYLRPRTRPKSCAHPTSPIALRGRQLHPQPKAKRDEKPTITTK